MQRNFIQSKKGRHAFGRASTYLDGAQKAVGCLQIILAYSSLHGSTDLLMSSRKCLNS